jgi:5-methylthioribose kinase
VSANDTVSILTNHFTNVEISDHCVALTNYTITMQIELNYDIAHQKLTDWLHYRNWIQPDEQVIYTEKPGEGNMNLVMRVITNGHRLIIKQANPFVQKYPSIAAPQERVAVEAAFYELAAQSPDLQRFLPGFIGFDPDSHILAVEDLGESSDYTYVYSDAQNGFGAADLLPAVQFLSALHNTDFDTDTRLGYPTNMALRRLNHEHLIVYPYMTDNGLNLDDIMPGLAAVAAPYKTDTVLRSAVEALGKIYLSSVDNLLHGDYYAGSWLKTDHGFRVIDPEFSFFGPAEYDFGVLMAHIRLGHTPADVLDVTSEYAAPKGFDAELARRFEGMEILRRLIGLAQLPLGSGVDVQTRSAHLAYARSLVLGQ